MNNLNFDDLKNQVCAITGGAGVIGSALAEGLASADIHVAFCASGKNGYPCQRHCPWIFLN